MSQHRSASGILQRKTLSASGCLGGFYDIRQDRLVGECDLTAKVQIDKLCKANCVLIKSDTDDSWDFLRTIVPQDDLRLSLLLSLAPTVGIAAFLNHHHEINTFTRILYYSYQENEKHLREGDGKNVKSSSLVKPGNDATHVISSICFGIDAVVILQIPRDANINWIDQILSEIRKFLLTDLRDTLQLDSEERNILDKLTSTTVYSNIPTLTSIRKVCDIPERIASIKKHITERQPIIYYLQPLKWLYPQYDRKEPIFYVLPAALKKNLEQFILDLRTRKNNLEISFPDTKLTFLTRFLQKHISGVRQEWFELKKIYNTEIKRLSGLISDARKGQRDINEIGKALNSQAPTALKNQMDNLIQRVNDLKAKGQFISDLRQQRFEYYNVFEYNVVKTDREKDLVQKLIKGEENKRIICSMDPLNRSNSEQFEKLRSDLVKQQKTNPNLRLIYADFSYCSYKLSNMMILTSNDTNNNKHIPKKKRRSSSRRTRTSASPLQEQKSPPPTVPKAQRPVPLPILPPLPPDHTINILLLGETGVGKSTFINAFVNYLSFDSFEQAQSDEPTVLITASFLITTGDDFEEHIIKIVDVNNSSNEDFDRPGQSVTQQCRSYVFPLPHHNGRKLRIIDTPGFGDTRGLDQDDLNIEHILQYINNLTHLNAICFLFKPNASRLNMFFRTWFMQLFSLLGPNAEQNIIFCFTNARSTFYVPGDTAPLLKEMLRSLPMNNISFNKETTFCFDNESFRYLVALQNGILFTELDKHEYERSWSVSVKESNRLLEYISTKLTVYPIHDGRQTIKYAQLEIALLIRPMLETIRNILRNLILYEKKVYDQSIIMSAQPLQHPAARCRFCKSDPIEVGPFLILPDVPHRIQNDCLESTCTHDQHIPIDYVLEYDASDDDSDFEEQGNLSDMLHQLCDASVEFAYFLMYVAHSTKDDPFEMGLMQMTIDENELCNNQRKSEFNLQLAKELRKILVKHEQHMSKLKPDRKTTELSVIYDLMYTIEEYSMVHEQMIAVKQTQATIMEQYEYEVQKI